MQKVEAEAGEWMSECLQPITQGTEPEASESQNDHVMIVRNANDGREGANILEREFEHVQNGLEVILVLALLMQY